MNSANVYSIKLSTATGGLQIRPERVTIKERAENFRFKLQTFLRKIGPKWNKLVLVSFIFIFPSYSVKLMRSDGSAIHNWLSGNRIFTKSEIRSISPLVNFSCELGQIMIRYDFPWAR